MQKKKRFTLLGGSVFGCVSRWRSGRMLMSKILLAIDLITFFDPVFWGLQTEAEVIAYGQAQPRRFWDRILDTVVQSGVEGIELTFSPFDWENTIAAYGSISQFGVELERRGLRIASGFFADVAISGGLGDQETEDKYLRSAEHYAIYLAAMGSTTMVMGLPMRSSWDTDPPRFVDVEYMSVVADFCNRLGAIVLRKGVTLALHNEAHSVFSTARDVDLLMLLTDPIFVAFCPDTAHLLLSGSEPVSVVARHRERVVIAHWKDATGPAPLRIVIDEAVHLQHRSYFCALGDGQVAWPRFMELLRDRNFAGWAVLEIDAVPDPASEVLRSTAFVRDTLFPIYS